MDIEPYYDRGELVKLTTHTVLENLARRHGARRRSCCSSSSGNTRAALITALNIPLALLIAFMRHGRRRDTSANLISLGAVDFGIVVDSTVIMMENIFRHLGPHGKGTMQRAHPRAARARSAGR